MADALRQPAARLAALSRRSTLATLTGDFASAIECARQAFRPGRRPGCPRPRWTELATTGLESLRPDMLYLWALAELARGCVLLRAAHHAPRIYQALAPYAGRAAVAAGAVMCSGSTDFYLAGLAALGDDVTAAERHYRAAVSCHRRLGARPMLAHTLRDYALLLRQRADPDDLPAASAALAEARAIAVECGMTKLLAALDQPDQPTSILTLNREDDFWLIGYRDALARVPDSLGLR